MTETTVDKPRYQLRIRPGGSKFRMDVRTVEVADLGDAIGQATRWLRAERLSKPDGHYWNRWEVWTMASKGALPVCHAYGSHMGTAWSLSMARKAG